MKELPSHARVYLVLVMIAGYLAMGQLLHRSTTPSITKLVILILLAATCGPLRIRLPRAWSSRDRAEACPESFVSVGVIFLFAAILELPARYACLVGMVKVISQLQLGGGGRRPIRDYLFPLSAVNLGLLLAYDTYYGLASRLIPPAPVMIASILYFLVMSWSHAAAVSLPTNTSVTATWRRDFLPTAPLYPVMAGGGALLQLLFNPSHLHTFVLAFPVICLFYYCYEYYFGRLQSECRHAREMSQVHRRTVEALALAMDAKDRVTSGHLRRVQRYAALLGRRLGCTDAQLQALEIGSLLHDIGKIAVPEYVLSKPGRLTRQEFNQIAVHPQVGAEILAAVNFPFPVAELVHSHHENWDGSGYPRGLQGEQIPLIARILSVVDCFDALISDRPYRPAFPLDKALEMLRSRRGSTFDPRVVDALVEMLPQLKAEWQQAGADSEWRITLQSPRAIEAQQTSLTADEFALDARGSPVESVSLRLLLDNLGASLQVEEVCHLALSEVGRVIPFDAAAIFLMETNGLVTAHHTWPMGAKRSRLRIPMQEGPTGWAAAQGATLVNGNPKAEAGDLGRLARDCEWRDALIVPLWSDRRVMGTLSLYSQAFNAYSEDQARLAELMTANLGLTLANVRSYQQLVTVTTDPQTGLPNARAAMEMLKQSAARADNHFTLLLVECGATGSAGPATLANALRRALRESDFLGRLADHQYLALLPRLEPAEVEQRLGQLRHAGFSVAAPLHAGAASFPAEAPGAEPLLCLAHHRLLADRSGPAAPAAPVLAGAAARLN